MIHSVIYHRGDFSEINDAELERFETHSYVIVKSVSWSLQDGNFNVNSHMEFPIGISNWNFQCEFPIGIPNWNFQCEFPM